MKLIFFVEIKDHQNPSVFCKNISNSGLTKTNNNLIK